MNEHFVSIKVDREERPDVDGLYMTRSRLADGPGRLADDRLPAAGRPPVLRRDVLPARGARRAAVLPAGAGRHRDRPTASAATWSSARPAELAESLQEGRLGRPPAGFVLSQATLLDALLTLRGQHDERNGGFGRAPKFPPHSVLTFLLRMHRRSGSEEALAMALRTLQAHGRRRHPRPARRRLPPLCGRCDLARAALRADALRQRAARARVPGGLAGDGRRAVARGRPRASSTTCCASSRSSTAGSPRRRTPTPTASRARRSRGRPRSCAPRSRPRTPSSPSAPGA